MTRSLWIRVHSLYEQTTCQHITNNREWIKILKWKLQKWPRFNKGWFLVGLIYIMFKLKLVIEVKTGQTILYSGVLHFLDIANASQGWFLILALLLLEVNEQCNKIVQVRPEQIL